MHKVFLIYLPCTHTDSLRFYYKCRCRFSFPRSGYKINRGVEFRPSTLYLRRFTITLTKHKFLNKKIPNKINKYFLCSRLSIQHLLSITLITLPILTKTVSSQPGEHQGPQTCGGRLKGPVGIIQTPNFPNPFPVPIKCRWIIQHDIVNGTISIYFTQQYTTSGLTFTEYMYYDESYKLGERKALSVTEENITRIKWLQVFIDFASILLMLYISFDNLIESSSNLVFSKVKSRY